MEMKIDAYETCCGVAELLKSDKENTAPCLIIACENANGGKTVNYWNGNGAAQLMFFEMFVKLILKTTDDDKRKRIFTEYMIKGALNDALKEYYKGK